MSRLLKGNALIEDEWTLVAATAEDAALPAGKIIVPAAIWTARREQLLPRGDVGVWLDSDEDPALIADDLPALPLVAVNFPAFSDGRGFSTARLLRERYGFGDELRAIGDVLVDQLFFMKRCGFDSYALRDDQDGETAIAALGVFSESYQAATDEPTPLFRRR